MHRAIIMPKKQHYHTFPINKLTFFLGKKQTAVAIIVRQAMHIEW